MGINMNALAGLILGILVACLVIAGVCFFVDNSK